MERLPISALLDRSSSLAPKGVFLRLPTVNEPDAVRHDQIVVAREDNGKAVAFVARDDIFDADGNRFFNDV